MATITFDHVTKRHENGQMALSALDLHIEEGEFLILVGPSGCGKSTALRIVAGLETLTSGQLLIDGKVATEASPRDRDMAMVFQSYALYPHLTVARNIGFGLQVRGAAEPEIDRKVRDVAALLELSDLLGRRPAQLSGGQRQRVAMARALVRSPNALLMDEPLSNLDARLRGQMRMEIASLQRRSGVTTLYVTHDQVEAMTMGTRVAVLNRGSLQQVGTPRSLYDTPVNRFVAGFIGSPAMNFLEAHVERVQNAAWGLRFGGHTLSVADEGLAAMPAMAGRIGRPVVVGLRPDAFRLVDATDPAALSGTVRGIEDFGATALVAVDLEVGAPLGDSIEEDGFAASRRPLDVMLDSGQRVRPGEAIHLAVDTRRLHLFEPGTGAALRL